MLYDDINKSCDKTRDIAVSQAAKKNHQLIVIANGAQSKQYIEKLLSEHGGQAACEIADFSDVDNVTALIYKYSPGLLVLPESSRLIDDEQVLQRLLDQLETDILLVR